MPQILVTVNDRAMLPRVRSAILTLQGVERVATPAKEVRVRKPRLTAIQKKQLARLDELGQLAENWDDEGAFPIETASMANVRSLIMTNGGKLLESWVIFPVSNGTLELAARHRRAVICVGNNDYSYVYHGTNRDESASHEKIDTYALTQLIKHINE